LAFGMTVSGIEIEVSNVMPLSGMQSVGDCGGCAALSGATMARHVIRESPWFLFLSGGGPGIIKNLAGLFAALKTARF